MQFTTTSGKADVLEANVTSMNTVKKNFFFEFRKTIRSTKQ